MIRRVLLPLLGLLLLTGLAWAPPAAASGGAAVAPHATVSRALRTAVADLPVATEVRTGYARTKFPLWIDADGDGCDTRKEVLIAESTITPTIGASCAVSGKWFSYYDGATWTAASDVDIDHLVPLAEAWDSGARNWTTAQRQAYANDLGDPRDLVAVTDNVNQSKGDQDPAEWLPTLSVCRYIGEWAAVKTRWSLTVDTAEKSTLTSLAASCPNVTITVTTQL